jgi:hypothetical protein
MAEKKEDIIRKHVRVRNLLTSVALAMGHYKINIAETILSY